MSDEAATAKRDFRKEVTDSIIEMLEKGTTPWQKPWDPQKAFELPFNPNSQKAYRGGNALHLMAAALKKGYEDPRWMTYRQAQEHGWQVRKGEKGTYIEFWQFRDERSDRQATNETDNESSRGENSRGPLYRVYTVFNAQQIDGIPAHTRKQLQEWEVAQAGEQILKNSGANISHDQRDRAFYNRATDSIHLPPQRAFFNAADYYGTALHELAHWSGHPERLNRQTLNESYRFGDPAYAKEELRAELTSVFLAAERGIPHNPEQHAAYVGSWISVLKEDKNEIFRAAKDAHRAADFLLELEKEKAIEKVLESVNREASINARNSRKPAKDERANAPSLKQVAALTWETDSALAAEDLIRAAAQVRAAGGKFLIHNNSYRSTEGITEAHRKVGENLNALRTSSDPDWKRHEIASSAGSSFATLVAELGLPRTVQSLELLNSYDRVPSDPAIQASFLNGFAHDVRSRRTEQEDIWPGSPESIKARAEREQFIQAVQRKLGREFETSSVRRETSEHVAAYEPGSGTVDLVEKETATEHREPVAQGRRRNPDRLAAAGLETEKILNGEVNGRRAPSESVHFDAARAITQDALGDHARLYAAHTDSGRYSGEIIGVTSDHVIQKLGAKSAVAHPRQLLPGQPGSGDNLTISYSNGQALMRAFEPRTKSKELAR